MKKMLSVVVGVILVSVLALSFAKESEKTEEVMWEAGKVSAAEQGKMPAKEQMIAMCPMHRMMMQAMMSKCIAMTSDGGVVVMMGERLMKFDKDLSLVKETQVPVFTEAMQNEMCRMTAKCPMCSSMMQKFEMMKEAPSQ